MDKFPLETFEENLLPTYTGYHVSENGDVYSRLNRNGTKILESFWRKKKIGINKAGYPMTMMVKSNGKQCATPIHHLVALAYIGERPDGFYVCHCDGNQKNNHVSNLRYGTPKSNSEDKHLHGTMPKGEDMPHSVLKENDILPIFNFASTGMRIKEIARLYNVTAQTISQTLRREHWKHVPIDACTIEKARCHTSSGLSLSEQDVRNIFEWRSKKIAKKQIANHFGIAEQTLRDILDRKIMFFVNIGDELIQEARKHRNGYCRISLKEYIEKS